MINKLCEILSNNEYVKYVKYVLGIVAILLAICLFFGMGKRFGEFIYCIIN